MQKERERCISTPQIPTKRFLSQDRSWEFNPDHTRVIPSTLAVTKAEIGKWSQDLKPSSL